MRCKISRFSGVLTLTTNKKADSRGESAEFVSAVDYVEILYFGLLPDYIGKGIGKLFLQWVVEKAWSFQPKWVQLNTCELDHPNALQTYLKAGFKLVREEIQERKVLIE